MEFEDALDPQLADEGEQRPGLPVFSLVMVIVDMCLSGLRVPLVILSFHGWSRMGPSHPLAATAPWEAITGTLLALTGLSAGALLLSRKKTGIYLGILAMASVVGNLVVAGVQIAIQLKGVPMGSPHATGMIIGAAFVMILRLGENALYAAALVVAHKSGALE